MKSCLLLLFVGILGACSKPEAVIDRDHLTYEFLTGDEILASPVPSQAFTPGAKEHPGNRFEGSLVVEYPQSGGSGRIIVDDFELAQNSALDIWRLPPIRVELVQSGSELIPVQRGAQVSEHPHWEFLIEPGVVWDEPGDGNYSRAAMPIALQERNANCTHNGLLTFLFTGSGEISRVAYQVASETCAYLQFDLWGTLEARYEPHSIIGGGIVIQQHRNQQTTRLPVRAMSALGADYPDVDDDALLEHQSEEVTTYGFLIDGVHYSGGCQTRMGPYPFCESLVLPSYSLAKTVFAGSMLAWMEQQSPGAGNLLVTDYVPECTDDDRWQGVTLEHLIDMSSGNFGSTEIQVDEFYSYTTDFIDSDQHADKIAASCGLFERRAEPGSTYVYHSTETYIAGTLMNAWLRESGRGEDIHRDVLVEQIMKPLRLSPLTHATRRTYDETSQPFTGFGLTFLSDDIVRFAQFLLDNKGMVGGEQVLSLPELDAALQRVPEDPGLRAGAEKFRYNNGVKAMNVADYVGCDRPVWVPFMSGYGGISVVMFPNETVYYVFSDGGNFHWAGAAKESNKIISLCEKT